MTPLGDLHPAPTDHHLRSRDQLLHPQEEQRWPCPDCGETGCPNCHNGQLPRAGFYNEKGVYAVGRSWLGETPAQVSYSGHYRVILG